jgi:hypothetical protein
MKNYLLLHLETREICDRECIRGIIRLWDFTESEEHLESFLDLRFFGESVPCYPSLHLQWRILDEWDTTSGKRIDHDSPRLCDIYTVRHIAKKKQTLHPTNRRTIRIEYLTKISPDLYETISKLHTRTSRDHSIFEYCYPLSLLLEDSESGRSGSWIYTEDYHSFDSPLIRGVRGILLDYMEKVEKELKN